MMKKLFQLVAKGLTLVLAARRRDTHRDGKTHHGEKSQIAFHAANSWSTAWFIRIPMSKFSNGKFSLGE